MFFLVYFNLNPRRCRIWVRFSNDDPLRSLVVVPSTRNLSKGYKFPSGERETSQRIIVDPPSNPPTVSLGGLRYIPFMDGTPRSFRAKLSYRGGRAKKWSNLRDGCRRRKGVGRGTGGTRDDVTSIGRLLLLSRHLRHRHRLRHCLRLLLLFSPTMSNIVVLFIG